VGRELSAILATNERVLMDFLQMVGFAVTTFGVSAAGAWWLAKGLVEHRLARALEELKIKLSMEMESKKAEFAGAIKLRIDTELGDIGAQRQYEFDAKRRLYTAISPLKFQLLIACRDFSQRVTGHGSREVYSTSLTSYYGQSFTFRILRLFAICELIERQMSFADFSVDSASPTLIRFSKSIAIALSGGDLVKGHSKTSWNNQVEHVFYDSLSRAANAIIKSDGPTERVMRFHEFSEFLSTSSGLKALHPFPSLMEDFAVNKKPLWWTRLVAVGYLCNRYVNEQGATTGLTRRDYEVGPLLLLSGDVEIKNLLEEYVSRCLRLPVLSY
jgi:hypothetical protein